MYKRLMAFIKWTAAAACTMTMLYCIGFLGELVGKRFAHIKTLSESYMCYGPDGKYWSGACIAPKRKVYPYSLVPGGVTSPAELQAAEEADPLVAEADGDLDLRHATVIALDHDEVAWVAYRKNGQLLYSRATLHKGELILTDGKHRVRGRCANRIKTEQPAGFDSGLMPIPLAPLLPVDCIIFPMPIVAPPYDLGDSLGPISSLPPILLLPIAAPLPQLPTSSNNGASPVTGFGGGGFFPGPVFPAGGGGIGAFPGAVPEPPVIALVGLALVGLAVIRRKRA